jgi:hypothetical protein
MLKPDDADKDDDGAGLSPAAGRLLPLDRAFVVQFTNDTDAGLTRCSGRVEHVESGRRGRFSGLAELLAFVERVLDRAEGRAGE